LIGLCLALVGAACGEDGARSAGPVPSVTVDGDVSAIRGAFVSCVQHLDYPKGVGGGSVQGDGSVLVTWADGSGAQAYVWLGDLATEEEAVWAAERSLYDAVYVGPGVVEEWMLRGGRRPRVGGLDACYAALGLQSLDRGAPGEETVSRSVVRDCLAGTGLAVGDGSHLGGPGYPALTAVRVDLQSGGAALLWVFDHDRTVPADWKRAIEERYPDHDPLAVGHTLVQYTSTPSDEELSAIEGCLRGEWPA
jgi:hypothetical protein